MSINLFSSWQVGISLLSLFAFILILVGIRQKQAVLSILDIFSVLSEGKEWASQLKTSEAVLEYIIAHPHDVSLVAYEVGYSEQEIFYNCDIKRPLASTIKILILAEYARQVNQGLLSPQELVNLENIDLYYLPRTDGDAHPSAVAEFKQRQYINSANQVELCHIPWAMIRYSDNAATDYLIQLLGRENLNNLVSSLNIKNQDVPLPFIGQILTWSNHTSRDTFTERLQKYQTMSPKEYGDEVYRLTKIWESDEEFRTKQLKHITSTEWLKLKEQQAMAHALNGKGTASGYAQIMERIYRGLLISSEADKIMRQYLEWTMEIPRNQQQLDTFGAKNGSLAGIITDAWYLKPKSVNNGRVAALFFENIPPGAWFNLLQNYIQQEFLYKLLTDEDFFNLVREKLFEM
jgi:D-alanyl-D-alanine carboxypeptidase